MALLGNLKGSAQVFQDTDFYNGVATQSLRFDDGSSPELTFTPSSAGNRKTNTFSVWVKRGIIGTNQNILKVAGNSDTTRFDFYFDSNDDLNIAGQSTYFRLTDAKYRDVGSWYHFVVAFDTTQSTANDRLKIYQNGTQITSFSTNNAFSQNTDYALSNTVEHQIGKGYGFFDGYMAEINFVDGLQLDPTYFGETKNGVWVAKKYTGSYGTNGFRLEFKNTSVGSGSSSTIGADTSGNTNHFTSSGIVASDCNMPDSPENNFCTLNGVAKSAGLTLSEGNLQTNNANDFALGTIGVSSGKWYYENYINSTNGGFAGVYEADVGVYSTTVDDGGNNPNGYGIYSDGRKLRDGSYTSYGNAFQTAGDIIGVALDMDNGAIYFSKNGTWQNSATASEIAAGTTTNAAFTGLSGTMVARVGHYNNNNPTIVNFGQDDTFVGAISSAGNTDTNGRGVFKYAPPTDFLALCSANLPEPTIGPNSATQADDHFDQTLFDGTGSSPLAVTGMGHQPDLLWLKRRDNATNGHHILYDSTRGGTNALRSSTNTAEAQFGDMVITFQSDGFSFTGTDGLNASSSYNNVAWSWLANGGTTVTNDASATGVGSIDSVYQANTTAGFSIVTYTGSSSGNNGTASTVAHGLDAVPKWIFFLPRDTYDGCVYHAAVASDPATDKLLLKTSTYADSNTAASDDSGFFNDTEPTSTVFSVGTRKHSNSNGGMVAYCWAEVEGFSKFGSLFGNASNNGAFVYTGFAVKWVMFKNVEATAAWIMQDTARDTFNVATKALVANFYYSESTVAARNIDFLSNGFKLRTTAGDTNGNGQRIVYMAFAEAPFKYANAR